MLRLAGVVSALLTALCTLGALSSPARAQTQPLLDLSAGRLHFELRPNDNTYLTVDGVPVVYRSTLYLMQPGWTGVLLDQDTATPTVSSTREGGAQVGTAAYDTPDASAHYRFEVRPDNTFRVTLTYSGKGAPGIVQYWAGLLNANLLAGAPYHAETVDGPRDGVVPLFATTADQIASKLTPNVKSITFDTVLGRIGITVEGSDATTSSLNLFDARLGTSDWAKKNPAFWLGIGVPDPELAPGEHTVTITYTFGQPIPKATIPAAEGNTSVQPVATAVVPFAKELPIIPRPKEQTTPDAPPVRVTEATQIVVPDAPTPEEKEAAHELASDLANYWGVKVPIKRASDSRATSGMMSRIVLTRTGAISQPFGKVDDVQKPEGYTLKAGGSLVAVGGTDPRGVYNGAQTVKQLIRVDQDGVYIKPADIRDWPSLSFRGVHWFGGSDAWPFDQKMIDRIIAPLKMNAMVYQVDYTQWATQPKIWNKERSTPKADVKKAVDYARAHFIEPIPMLNGMGHAEWLFQNGQNMDLAADPTHPYAYNPENPRTYDVLFPIMQEAINLFHPKYFHIGNDEVTNAGTFPPAGVTKSVTDLMIEDTKRRHDWLARRGIRTMMWGDMLLYKDEATDASNAPTKAEAARRRDGIPKDIIIADWHYQGSNPDFPSVDVLQKAGFSVVGTTWYDWGNIQNFSRVLNQQNAMGFLQSTWAGYSMSLDLVKGESFPQFVAYLLGAEYAWNGGQPDVKDLGYSPDDAFLTFWDRRPMSMLKQPGFTVDLSGVSNTGMWDWVPGTGTRNPKPETRSFPTGQAQLGGVVFDTGHPVWLAGALNPAGAWPKEITVPLGSKTASALQMLWGTTYSAPYGTPVGTLRVAYTDGTTSEMPLRYGQEAFAFDDQRSGPAAPTAWTGTDPYGETASARRVTWDNPHPKKPIRSLTLETANGQAAPVLLGLTGVQ